MAISLLGKIVILVVSLLVIGGLTTVIVFVVQDATAVDDSNGYSTTSTEPPGPGPPGPGDALYEVGVGIADMTGPCVEIAFVSNYAQNNKLDGLKIWQVEDRRLDKNNAYSYLMDCAACHKSEL